MTGEIFNWIPTAAGIRPMNVCRNRIRLKCQRHTCTQRGSSIDIIVILWAMGSGTAGWYVQIFIMQTTWILRADIVCAER